MATKFITIPFRVLDTEAEVRNILADAKTVVILSKFLDAESYIPQVAFYARGPGPLGIDRGYYIANIEHVPEEIGNDPMTPDPAMIRRDDDE